MVGSALSYQLSKCYSRSSSQRTQSVTIFGIDADHNYILGAGAPASTLTSDDGVHLAVTSASPASPTTYLLSDPTGALPSARSAVHLTAKVTPAAASGGTPVSALFSIAFTTLRSAAFSLRFHVPADGSAHHWRLPTDLTARCGLPKATLTRSDALPRAVRLPSFRPAALPTGSQRDRTTRYGSRSAAAIQIGQIATTGGTVYEYHVPTSNSGLYNITADPRGGFPWFTETLGNNVDSFRESGGVPTVRETAVTTSAARPWGITAGPDGNMWFTEETGNNIGRLAGGVVTEFPIPTTMSSPEEIASGPDGNVWFTEGLVGKIGRITTGGTITEFALPAVTSLEGIAAGSDGAMYFADDGTSKIGRITTTGTISEFSLPKFGTPNIIVQGPDNNMWFTDIANQSIIRMQ